MDTGRWIRVEELPEALATFHEDGENARNAAIRQSELLRGAP